MKLIFSYSLHSIDYLVYGSLPVFRHERAISKGGYTTRCIHWTLEGIQFSYNTDAKIHLANKIDILGML